MWKRRTQVFWGAQAGSLRSPEKSTPHEIGVFFAELFGDSTICDRPSPYPLPMGEEFLLPEGEGQDEGPRLCAKPLPDG